MAEPPAGFQDTCLGFIGAGNMAEAIARGVIEARLIPAQRIAASDPVSSRRELFASLGATATDKNKQVLETSDLIVLAVKPQVLDAALTDLRAAARPEHLFISICAGVPTRRIEHLLPAATRVVRVMPNTPMLVGEGAAALSRGAHATAEDLDRACRLFATAAKVVVPLDDEGLLDAVTALSGSGPAYVFYLVERMVAAAAAAGMDPRDALKLATQTVAGAAALLQKSGESPERLRRKVTSPGGTTQAAIEHLEAHGVGAILEAAVCRAVERSRELGER